MELEYKFAIPDDETADALQRNAQVTGTPDVIEMSARYYDTQARTLREKYLTLRLRGECVRDGAARTVCCLKAPPEEDTDPALRKRVELECEAPDIHAGLTALLRLPETLPYAADLTSAQKAGLVVTAELAYTRREYTLHLDGAVCTLCIDTGTLGHEPLRELELELKDGTLEPVTQLARTLAKRYRLTPETRSKYARALMG